MARLHASAARVERARFFLENDHLTGRLHGKEAGILQQDLVLPPSFAFSAPAIAASGWMGLAAASGATSQLVCYVAPSGFQSPLGTTCVVTGEEAVKTPAGEFQATHLARQSGAEASDWWIHPELGIPVRGQIVGGLEYVLSRLEMGSCPGNGVRSPLATLRVRSPLATFAPKLLTAKG